MRRATRRIALCGIDHGLNSSVVLLEIDATGVTVFKLECDAPRTIDMDRIPRRSKASQGVKVKAWHVHFVGTHDNIQTVQATQDAGVHLGIDLASPPALPKLSEAFAFEALDHDNDCKLPADECQQSAYMRRITSPTPP